MAKKLAKAGPRVNFKNADSTPMGPGQGKGRGPMGGRGMGQGQGMMNRFGRPMDPRGVISGPHEYGFSRGENAGPGPEALGLPVAKTKKKKK